MKVMIVLSSAWTISIKEYSISTLVLVASIVLHECGILYIGTSKDLVSVYSISPTLSHCNSPKREVGNILESYCSMRPCIARRFRKGLPTFLRRLDFLCASQSH